MIKFCLKMSLVLCAISIGIGTSFSSNSEEEEYDLGEKSPLKKSPDTDWEISGNFGEPFNHDNNSPINRTFTIKPKYYESPIDEINVNGYKDDNIIIHIRMKEKNTDTDSVVAKNGYIIEGALVSYYKSSDKDKLDEFLSVFVKLDLITESIAKEILKKIKTEVPSEEDLKIYNSKFEIYNKIKNEIKEVNKIGQKYNLGKFSSKEAKAVYQGAVGFTQANKSHPIIGSFGAADCLLMAVYNRKTKTAALGHIGLATTLSSVTTIFYSLQTKNEDNLEIHLAGGNSRSMEMIHELLKLIKQTQNVEIKSSKLLPGRYQKLAIDARTGEVITDFSIDQLTLGDFEEKRADAAMRPNPLVIEPGLELEE